MLEEWVKRLVDELDLEDMPPKNQDGAFLLSLDENSTFYLLPNEKGASLYTFLGPYPEKFEDEILEYLMYANLFSQGTGASNTIGYNNEKKQLTLQTEIFSLKDYEHFKLRLETLANYADYWREALANAQAKVASPLFD